MSTPRNWTKWMDMQNATQFKPIYDTYTANSFRLTKSMRLRSIQYQHIPLDHRYLMNPLFFLIWLLCLVFFVVRMLCTVNDFIRRLPSREHVKYTLAAKSKAIKVAAIEHCLLYSPCIFSGLFCYLSAIYGTSEVEQVYAWPQSTENNRILFCFNRIGDAVGDVAVEM